MGRGGSRTRQRVSRVERRPVSGDHQQQDGNHRRDEGLRAVQPGSDVIVRSDSEYVVKTMMLGWKRNANQEFWRELDREVAARQVRFEWVRGHAGDKNNERADKLAASAARGIRLELEAGPIGGARRERPRKAGAAA